LSAAAVVAMLQTLVAAAIVSSCRLLSLPFLLLSHFHISTITAIKHGWMHFFFVV
jgi:hypothetical protein